MSLSFEQQDEKSMPCARVLSNKSQRVLYLNSDQSTNKSLEDIFSELGDQWFYENTPLQEPEDIQDFYEMMESGAKPKQKEYLKLYNYLLSLQKVEGKPIIDLPEGMKFVPLPMPDIGSGREVISFIGMSGSGKSYLCNQYVKGYQRMYPLNPVYIFSKLDKDESLDDGIKAQRLACDNAEDLKENPYDSNNFKDCLVIFDDCSSLDKACRDVIQKLQDSLLETGRHNRVSIAVCTHDAFSGRETKILKNEAHTTVIYPQSCAPSKAKTYLIDTFGLDKKQADTVFKLPSRWICVRRSYPPLVLTENVCYLKNSLAK